MKQKHSIRDRVRVQVVSADIWQSIRVLNEHSIPVFHVQQTDELTYSFQIPRKHDKALRTLLNKRGDRVSLLQKNMVYSLRQSLRKRPVLYSGILLFLVLSLILPGRLLAIQVEGNSRIPARKIREAAEEIGISLFSPCVQVRSEKMKNALLTAIPELQWAGINTYGSRAVISVRERAQAEGKISDPKIVSSIVAVRDGIVQSATAERGTIQCQPGQAVKAGQVLISGYTDCGLSIQAERAQGEVYGQTLRTIQAVTPSECLTRGETQRVGHSWGIIIGKKRINLWKDSGIWDSTCGRISREYPLVLPGGFTMPVSLVWDTYIQTSMEAKTLDESTAREELTKDSRNDLCSQMIAGTICHADEVMQTKPGLYLLSGQYICTEMIGRERLENGVAHE